jgi:SagB-type dehydrogenase family enzyme
MTEPFLCDVQEAHHVSWHKHTFVELLADSTSALQYLDEIWQWIGQGEDHQLVKKSLRQMLNGELSLDDLARTRRVIGISQCTLLDVIVCQSSKARLLCLTIRRGGLPVVRYRPNGKIIEDLEAIYSPLSIRLSRFSFIRLNMDGPILESGLTASQIHIDPSFAGEFATLTVSGENAQQTEDSRTYSKSLVEGVRALLVHGGFTDEHDADPGLSMWEFHDLLMHSRVRLGRTVSTVGRSTKQKPTKAPPPFRQPFAGPVIGRVASTHLDVDANGHGLFHLLSTRRSGRTSDGRNINKDTLFAILYQSSRCISTVPTNRADQEYVEKRHVYPTAGGAGELETFAVVRSCEGIEAGLYHYNAENDTLSLLKTLASDRRELFRGAAQSAENHETPSVLIVITARIARTMWKYETLSYSLIMKDAGCLLQTLYLVTLAFGINGCAIGAGDADLFSRMLGTSCYEETSMAEFAIF